MRWRPVHANVVLHTLRARGQKKNSSVLTTAYSSHYILLALIHKTRRSLTFSLHVGDEAAWKAASDAGRQTINHWVHVIQVGPSTCHHYVYDLLLQRSKRRHKHMPNASIPSHDGNWTPPQQRFQRTERGVCT